MKLRAWQYLKDLHRWQGEITAAWVSEEEVARALGAMTRGKAPGPDGIQVAVSQQLTSLLEPLAILFTTKLRTGRFPKEMLQTYIVPIDKPGQPTEKCLSKRPITLICAIAEVYESIILGKLSGKLENQHSEKQYAYKRGVGAELHKAELLDFATELVNSGHHVGVTILDVDGAFGTVSHRLLIETLRDHRVDKYVIRSVSTWLQNRIFLGHL